MHQDRVRFQGLRIYEPMTGKSSTLAGPIIMHGTAAYPISSSKAACSVSPNFLAVPIQWESASFGLLRALM
jgi:hypothetical protein